MSTQDVPTPTAPLPPRARWFAGAAAAAVLAGIAILAYAAHVANRESTDDAFLDCDIVNVAPSVAGRVIEVPVSDNEWVRKGDLLAEIDPGTFEADLAERIAARGNAESSVAAAEAQLDNARAHLRALEAAFDQARADAVAAGAVAVRTATDLARDADLVRNGAITRQAYDQGKASAAVAQADLAAARERIAGAAAQVLEARTNVPLAEANLAAERAATEQAAAAERSARIDFDDTRICAPIDGRVTRKSVDVGDYVQIGQALLALVPSRLWVTANYKENQLAHMEPGEQVDVRIDAEGGRVYRAHVDSIQAGSGSRFSLFPPENATGNYVKIVQRVPVKIVFDEPLDSPVTLGPGESVEPDVHTHGGHISLVTLILVVVVDGLLIAGLSRISRTAAKA